MRLSRYEDSLGRSSGYWLVHEVEGLMVTRIGYRAWRLKPLNDPLVPGSRDFQKAEKTWGKGANPRKAMLLMQENPQLKKWFPTRDAALLALEKATANQGLNLGEVLSR